MKKFLDYFKVAAAFMVVAIHTAPFADWSGEVDVLITYCLFRVAVPFFLMVSGYFVVSDYFKGNKEKISSYGNRMLMIYLAATLLYLPVNWYAGKEVSGVFQAIKVFWFDGTFYHLWYLPGVILGCALVRMFYWLWGFYGSGVLALLLYGIGTLGDSYYGLAAQSYIGQNFYEEIFSFSQYTRNGIFYTPIFLWPGGAVRLWEEKEGKVFAEKKWWLGGLILSLLFLLLEGWITYRQGWQLHNSMYFMLPAVMYFGFRLLCGAETEKNSDRIPLFCRRVSLWIYLLHPLCIILLRGIAKYVGMTEMLVENSFLHYLAVCMLSFCLAGSVCLAENFGKKHRKSGKGRKST